MAQRDLKAFPEEGFDIVVGKDDLIPAFVRRWKAYLDASAKADDPVFRPWRRFAGLRDDEFAARAVEVTRDLHEPGSPGLNPRVARAVRRRRPRRSERSRSVTASCSPRSIANGRSIERLRRPRPKPCRTRTTRPSARSSTAPARPARSRTRRSSASEWFFDTDTIVQMWKLQGEVDRWLIQSPIAPPSRGGPGRSRGVARAAHLPAREPGEPGGRGAPPLPLGDRRARPEAVRSRERPPGTGTGDRRPRQPPDGPRLGQSGLDAPLRGGAGPHAQRLRPPRRAAQPPRAARLAGAAGWSNGTGAPRRSHRMILLSAAYQQRSDAPGDDRKSRAGPARRPREPPPLADEPPAADLRGGPRYPPGRLGRAGPAGRRPGGRAVPRRVAPTSAGRSTGWWIASSSRACSGSSTSPTPTCTSPRGARRRSPSRPSSRSTTRSSPAGRRPWPPAVGDAEPAEPVRRLYRAAYQREPTASQVRAALAFLGSAAEESTPTPRAGDASPGATAMARSIAAAGRVTGFRPLPHFNGTAWGGGPQWPDPAAGLGPTDRQGRARGQRPPARRDPPLDGPQEGDAGDPVDRDPRRRRRRRHPLLDRLQPQRGPEVGDGPQRQGRIRRRSGRGRGRRHDRLRRRLPRRAEQRSVPLGAEDPGLVTVPGSSWDAARDFSGPPEPRLSPREQLAQVLLMANELMFVD